MKSLGKLFRSRAIVCEQRARQGNEPAAKWEWTELATQWHALAQAYEEKIAGEDEVDVA